MAADETIKDTKVFLLFPSYNFKKKMDSWPSISQNQWANY